MSKSISQVVLDELGTNEIISFNLFEFTDGINTYRYTDCDIPLWVTVDGTTAVEFTPRGFTFDNINYSEGNIIDSATLKVDNVDQIMSSIFLGSVVQGNEATLWICILNSNKSILGVAPIFMGNIDGWALDESLIDISISNIFTRWHNSANNRYSPSCRWKKFKGTECKYAGAETECDRSYARCIELGNTANFGGFRWLPDLENRTNIWWGPKPKEQKR